MSENSLISNYVDAVLFLFVRVDYLKCKSNASSSHLLKIEVVRFRFVVWPEPVQLPVRLETGLT